MIQRDTVVPKELHKLLGLNVQSVKRMGVIVNSIQFYEEKTGNKVQSYLVTSKLLELYIFFGILVYLISLYLGL